MEFIKVRIGSNAAIAIGSLCLVAIMIAAIADQEFSWWVFPFGILFSTIFIGVLYLCFLNYRAGKFRRGSIVDYPTEPWIWDARWRSSIMTSRSKSEFWGTLVFAIILGMFALIGTASLLQGLSKGNLWVLLNLIPIVAAVYFGQNTYVAWRTLRLEKHVSLTSDTRPAWIGETFSALMETAAGHHPADVEACLELFKVLRRQDSDGVTLEKVVDRRLPGRVEDIGHGKARISVDIPQHSPTTSWSEDEQSRWWDLEISMRIAGTEVSLRYEVPVANPAEHQNP